MVKQVDLFARVPKGHAPDFFKKLKAVHAFSADLEPEIIKK